MMKHIQSALAVLDRIAHHTPILTSRALDERAEARIFLKCENFQRTGSFKFRGAYYALSRLSPEQRKEGVLAVSSGNHGQGVALAGKILGIPVTVLVPRDGARVKRESISAYGAAIIPCDFEETPREKAVANHRQKHGGVFIPPYDHPDIIAGQGTAAWELMHQAGGLNAVLAPCGGGGLLSGTAIAVKGLSSSTRVIGVEPSAADDANRSFHTGTLYPAPHRPLTIADGVRTGLGELPFRIIREKVDDMASVSEDAIREAVRFCFYRMKMVVEPSGAVALAAVISGAVRLQGSVGIIISGGNIDGEVMASVLH